MVPKWATANMNAINRPHIELASLGHSLFDLRSFIVSWYARIAKGVRILVSDIASLTLFMHVIRKIT